MSAQPIRVVVVGATGQTGRSVVNGLLSSPQNFEVTAFTRKTSLEKPELQALRAKGVKIAVADLQGGSAELVQLLQGIDIVISAIAMPFTDQIPLIDAAKEAGVKRFVPCSWQPVMPARGILDVRDLKEDINDHIKRSYLPYTIIDIGWWYQLAVPTLPSGRTGKTIFSNGGTGGDLPNSWSDVHNVGHYVARIITDPRTLNKAVFAYDDVLSPTEVHATMERVSGEKYEQAKADQKQLEENIPKFRKAWQEKPEDKSKMIALAMAQYTMSVHVRGDNTPEKAAYLGYLDARELYPDFKPDSIETWFQKVLDSNGEGALP